MPLSQLGDRHLEFPDDERNWRVIWFGRAYPSVVGKWEIKVDAFIAPVGEKSIEFQSLRRVSIDVGELSSVWLGSLWQDQHTTGFGSLESLAVTAQIEAKSLETLRASQVGLQEVWPIDEQLQQAWCVRFQGKKDSGKEVTVVIPCVELIRKYYAATPTLATILFRGGLDRGEVYDAKASKWDDGKGEVHLAASFKDPSTCQKSALVVGRIAFDSCARRNASAIHRSLAKSASVGNPAFPMASFPFEGKAHLLCRGVTYLVGKKPHFLVLHLEKGLGPVPFQQLTWFRRGLGERREVSVAE
jgi:hypothetical protein